MTGMDDTFRKIIRPVDARSSRGIYSRGKPVYRHGSNSPKAMIRKAAKRRLKLSGPTKAS